MLERGEYAEAQREMVRVCMPFMALWSEMESFTAGDGYLDKLCMELVGLDSSRSRPPTRDVRPLYREQARQMLLACGVPGRGRGGGRLTGDRRAADRPASASARTSGRRSGSGGRPTACVYGSIRRTCACPSVRRKTHATSQFLDAIADRDPAAATRTRGWVSVTYSPARTWRKPDPTSVNISCGDGRHPVGARSAPRSRIPTLISRPAIWAVLERIERAGRDAAIGIVGQDLLPLVPDEEAVDLHVVDEVARRSGGPEVEELLDAHLRHVGGRRDDRPLARA